MKQRTSLVLLLAVALLAGGIWAMDYFFKTKPGEPKRLFEPDRASVRRIAVRHGDLQIVLEKSGELWHLTLPVQAKANQRVVEQLLADIEFTRVEPGVTKQLRAKTSEELAAFGLDHPRLVIHVASQDKFTIAHVGKDAPIGHYVYARRDGKPDVFIVDKDIVEHFGRPVDDYRDRTLFDFGTSVASRVEIRSAGGPIELQRTNGAWQMVRPFQARADSQQFAQRLAELTMPAIQTFVTPPFEPLSAYGLAEPALTVTVWTDAAVAHTLLVGAPLKDKPELTYAKRKADDLIFTIKTELASKFGARPNDLRDRQIFHARSAEVDSVEIQAATQTVKLQREGAKWVLKSPVESAADAFEVRVFLEQLLGLSVKEFVEFPVTDMSSYGLHKPAAVVSLFGEAKRDQPAPLIGRLLIGGTDSDRKLVFVKREDEPFIYGVDAEARDKIKTDAVAFYDRAIFSFALTDFRRLTIEHDGRKATLEKTDQKWERAGDGAGEFDMGELIDTLGLIAELRAESFVADRPEALTEFGLDAPEWIITFVASRPSATGEPGAPTTHELRIAKETDANRRFAVVAGKPLIFEISKTLAARLQSLSRSLLAPADAPPVEKPAAPLPQPPPDHKE